MGVERILQRSVRVARRARGTVLVIVAVVALAVAFASAGLLAFAVSEAQTGDHQTNEALVRVATEGATDRAAFELKENLQRVVPNLDAGVVDFDDDPATTPLMAELTPQQIQQVLTSSAQEGVGRIGFPTLGSADGTVVVGQERIARSRTIDDVGMLADVSGPSDERLVEFLSDEQFVQRELDYRFHAGAAEDEFTIYAHGEVRQGARDIRTATYRKSYGQDLDFYAARERTLDDFSALTPTPPIIESPHDSTGMFPNLPYPQNMERSWAVTYTQDPAHPGREIKRIGLIFNDQEIGLQDPADQLTVANWSGQSFDPPFFQVQGPFVLGGAAVVEDPATDTTTMRLAMRSDAVEGPPFTPDQFGFRLGGIKYYFDRETTKAYFETPHPYGQVIEQGLVVLPVMEQTIWSPFNLTEDEAGTVVQPGDGGGGPEVIDPFELIEALEDPDPANIIQAMRVEFSGDFDLQPGDSLRVVNANNDQLLANYNGNAGAFAVTPFATRVRAHTPLGIKLQLQLDSLNNGPSYGYLVSAIEYVDGTGQLIRLPLPEQQTSHGASLGSLDDTASGDWRNTVCQPAPPGGAALLRWAVHFNRQTNLDGLGTRDADRITISYVGNGLGVPIPEQYVSPTGQFSGLIGTPGVFDIAELANKTYTLPPSIVALQVDTEVDDLGAYEDTRENFGHWIDAVSYEANNANDVARGPQAVAALPFFDRVAEYPPFGSEPDERGEWWVTIPQREEIALHFTRDEWRLGPGDTIEIWDGSNNLIASFTNTSAGEGFVTEEPGGFGGPIGELVADPNLPAELQANFGWILVPGDTARIVLRGDGDRNVGYNGFYLDRSGFFQNAFLTNSERELTLANPDEFNDRTTPPLSGFGEVRN